MTDEERWAPRTGATRAVARRGGSYTTVVNSRTGRARVDPMSSLSGIHGELKGLADQDSEKFLTGLLRAAGITNEEVLKANVAALDSAMPKWRSVAAAASSSVGSVAAAAERFANQMVPEQYKAITALAQEVGGAASSAIRGILPPETVAMIKQQAAEAAQRGGSFGEAASNIGLRDLGLTSLDMQMRGTQMATTATDMRGKAAMLGEAAVGAQAQVGAAALRAANVAQAFKAPIVGGDQILSTYGQGTVSPGDLLQASTNLFQNLRQQQVQLDSQRMGIAANQAARAQEMSYNLNLAAMSRERKPSVPGQVRRIGFGTASGRRRGTNDPLQMF